MLGAGNFGTLKESRSFNPFQPPVDRKSAVAAAYYDAIENSTADYIVQTRAKVETTGFSLLGIVGYGKAAASVSGQGLKLVRGGGRGYSDTVRVVSEK